MAHFSKIEDGIVVGVYVIANEEMVDENGVEQESLGIARCVELIGESTWVQTSYNNNFRKNYAGIGYAMTKQEMLLFHHNLIHLGHWTMTLAYGTLRQQDLTMAKCMSGIKIIRNGYY